MNILKLNGIKASTLTRLIFADIAVLIIVRLTFVFKPFYAPPDATMETLEAINTKIILASRYKVYIEPILILILVWLVTDYMFRLLLPKEEINR